MSADPIPASDICDTDAHVTYRSFAELLKTLDPFFPDIRFTEFPLEIREMVYEQYILDLSRRGNKACANGPAIFMPVTNVSKVTSDIQFGTRGFPPLCWTNKEMLQEVGTFMLRKSWVQVYDNELPDLDRLLNLLPNGAGYRALRRLKARQFRKPVDITVSMN